MKESRARSPIKRKDPKARSLSSGKRRIGGAKKDEQSDITATVMPFAVTGGADLDVAEKPNYAFTPPDKVIVAKEHSLRPPTPGFIQEEGFIDAFYQPRSLSALMLLLGLVIYVTIWKEEEMLDHGNRTRGGLLLGATAFLLYCAIQLRDGHLIRPHPALWRIVHGTGLLYFMLLVYLLCQDLAGIHSFLQLWDPTIGQKEAEHSYGSDCRLYKNDDPDGDPWRNIKDQVFDRFMIAHFLGWTVKALILRDWTLMWVASVLFEVLEVTFQHMYPNFNECWWDHLILDIFGCNLLGMILGMWLVGRFATHQFNWSGRKIVSIRNTFGKMVRVALQFTPYSFELYRWHVFESWRQFVIGSSVLFILLLGEMNAFFLKSTFGIPIKSDVNLYRLAFYVPLTYMSIFEFHRYAEGLSRRIGVNSWLTGSLVCLETLLVIKHAIRQRLFKIEELWPAQYIIVGWIVTGVLILLTGAVKGVRKLLFWTQLGADEVFDNKLGRRLNRPALSPSRKRVSLDELSEDRRLLIERGQLLDLAFRWLTFCIPVPLLIVLCMDCYRSFSIHPPPVPGKDSGW